MVVDGEGGVGDLVGEVGGAVVQEDWEFGAEGLWESWGGEGGGALEAGLGEGVVFLEVEVVFVGAGEGVVEGEVGFFGGGGGDREGDVGDAVFGFVGEGAEREPDAVFVLPGEAGGEGLFGGGFGFVGAVGGDGVGEGGEGDGGAVDALEAGGVVVGVGVGVDPGVVAVGGGGDFVEGGAEVEDVGGGFGGGGAFGDVVVGVVVGEGEHGHGEEVVLGVAGVGFVGEAFGGFGAVFDDVEFAGGADPALHGLEGEVGGAFEHCGLFGEVLFLGAVGGDFVDDDVFGFVPVVEGGAAAVGPFAGGGEEEESGEGAFFECGGDGLGGVAGVGVVGHHVFEPEAGEGVVGHGIARGFVLEEAEGADGVEVAFEAGFEVGPLGGELVVGDEVGLSAEEFAGGGDEVPVHGDEFDVVGFFGLDGAEAGLPFGEGVGWSGGFEEVVGVDEEGDVEIGVAVGGFVVGEGGEGAGEGAGGGLLEVVAVGVDDEGGGGEGEGGGGVLDFFVLGGVDDGAVVALVLFEEVDVGGDEGEVVVAGEFGGGEGWGDWLLGGLVDEGMWVGGIGGEGAAVAMEEMRRSLEARERGCMDESPDDETRSHEDTNGHEGILGNIYGIQVSVVGRVRVMVMGFRSGVGG